MDLVGSNEPDEKQIRVLLEKGATPSTYWSVEPGLCATPLSKAIFQKNISCIRLLLDFNVTIRHTYLQSFLRDAFTGYNKDTQFFKTIVQWFDDTKINWAMEIGDINYVTISAHAEDLFKKYCPELGDLICLLKERRELSEQVPKARPILNPQSRL